MDVSYIWQTIVQQEGGLVNDLRDKGGTTKFGISARAFPELRIQDISEEHAKDIFYEDYFKAIKGKDLVQMSPALALQMSDMAYNCGSEAAIRCLQKTLNSMDDNMYVFVDGHMSDRVLERVNDIVKNHGESDLAVLFLCQRIIHYAALADEDWILYSHGWVKRAFKVFASSGIFVKPEISDLSKTIINCLKPQETRLALRKDVLHSVNTIIQIIKKR